MSTRSMTPRVACSLPIGISVATTCGPKAAFSDSSERKKSARSRSSMFTKTRRAMSSSSARCQRRLVETSTPITALMTNTADSHTRRAPSASATKLGSPGVSRRLTLRSIHSNELRAAEIDMPRDCSSSSASETVVPSVTEPRRLVAPAWNSSASCNEVLPEPRWPTSATFLMRSAGRCMTCLLSSGAECWDPTPRPRVPAGSSAPRQGAQVLVLAGPLRRLGAQCDGAVEMLARRDEVAAGRLEACQLVVHAGAVREALQALGEDLPRALRVAALALVGGQEVPLPRARLERRRAAEAHDGRPRLQRDRVAVDLRIGQVHVGAGGRVDLVAVEREARASAEDEVELLVLLLGV